MEVRLTKYAGFCTGVDRALKLALKQAEEGREVYTLGPLVHNRKVIEYLKDRGIKYINSLQEIDEGTVIIRTHGVGPQIIDEAIRKKIHIIDATCPFVKKVQKTISSMVKENYRIIIVGDPEHPEVQGLVDWAEGQATVIEGTAELKKINLSGNTAVVAQTTLIEEYFNQMVKEIKKYNPEVIVNKTICKATDLRQKAALDLAKNVDLMIVIGGYNSSNTRKLAAVCKMTGTPTYHIEKAAELKKEWLENIKVTGVTAGASTPVWSIKEVIRKMVEYDNQKLNENQVDEETNEEKEEAVKEEQEILEIPEVIDSKEGTEESQVDTKGEAAEEGEEPDEITNDDDSKGIISIKRGQLIKGKVVQVTEDEVIVDIGFKADGIVPRSEINIKSGESLKDKVQVGDELDLVVLKVLASDEDRVILSKKRFDYEKGWEELNKHFEEEKELDTEVVEVVKGGLIVDLGIRGFLPASLVDLRYVPNLEELVGQKITVKIIELNRTKNKVVVSRKKVLEEEMEIKKKETLSEIEEGMTIKGIVRRLTDFGAFVDIGGIDGLVHISEISWQRIDNPSSVLKVGEEVEVKVLAVNIEDERISLSIKQAKPDPWTLVSTEFEKGDLVDGIVKCIVDFGVFVEILPGVEGLVHISQMADEHVTHPSEVVSEGEQITVKVLDINPENKRVSLSLREAKKDNKEEKHEVKVKGVEEEELKGGGVTLGDVFGGLFEKDKE